MMFARFDGHSGIKLAADVGGDPADPSVLLLPGFGQTRFAWARAAKALVAAGRHVVSLELRGHGDSDWSPSRCYSLDDIVQDVLAVLKQMPPRPAIVGTSAGALAALVAVGESAESIASALILIDAAPRLAREGMERMATLMTIDTLGFATVEEAADAVAKHMPNRARLDLEELRRHLRHSDDGLLRWHVDPAYAGFRVTPTESLATQHRLEKAAAALNIPTFLMRSDASELLDQASVARFRELVPHAEFADVAGVSQPIIGDRNDAFDATILEFLERVVPRASALRTQGGIEPRLLRDALGCFATGITVITTMGASGEPMGFTANSFTSVSLDPPLVLFCVKRDSPSLLAMRSRGAFAVNILHIGQQGISTLFATRTADRFAQTKWELWDLNVPIILDAMANFECTIHEVFDGGDHFVVIGRVRRVHFEPSRDPLLFLQGKYRRVHVARE